jgi:hypothetical protein
VSEESLEWVRQPFLCSLKKSVRLASHELQMSTMTVWRVLRKRLEMNPYHLHLVQFLQSFWYTVYIFSKFQKLQVTPRDQRKYFLIATGKKYL